MTITSEYIRRTIFSIVLSLVFSLGWGQVDSVSTASDSLPPKIDSGSDAGRPSRTFGSPATSDSIAVAPWFESLDEPEPQGFMGQLERKWENYQFTYGPKLYKNPEGKTRLYIRFPKRDSIDFPFPRGFLPAPTRPPFDPTIAWQRSALIPGWGQAYNRSAWKIPIFAAGYVGIGWWLNYNHTRYISYGDAYFCAAVLQPEGQECSIPAEIQAIGDTEGIRTRRNQFRQNRDNAILILIAWHGLQVIEAFVDAHLKNFDVSPDLSWQFAPSTIQVGAVGTSGLGIGLKF